LLEFCWFTDDVLVLITINFSSHAPQKKKIDPAKKKVYEAKSVARVTELKCSKNFRFFHQPSENNNLNQLLQLMTFAPKKTFYEKKKKKDVNFSTATFPLCFVKLRTNRRQQRQGDISLKKKKRIPES